MVINIIYKGICSPIFLFLNSSKVKERKKRKRGSNDITSVKNSGSDLLWQGRSKGGKELGQFPFPTAVICLCKALGWIPLKPLDFASSVPAQNLEGSLKGLFKNNIYYIKYFHDDILKWYDDIPKTSL